MKFSVQFLSLSLFLSLSIFPMKALATSLEEGIYQVNVQFANGPIFKDFVTFSKKEDSTFTVPGTLTERITFLFSKSNIEFTLNSSEGGRPFSFLFKGEILSGRQFEGIITDQFRNNEIGSFKAKKLLGEICE